MENRTLSFHPDAVEEAEAARDWYASRSERTATRFLAELERAFERIVATPKQWPPHMRGTRFFKLRRFPYLVVYKESKTAVWVVAVAHGRRKPGYWKKRL